MFKVIPSIAKIKTVFNRADTGTFHYSASWSGRILERLCNMGAIKGVNQMSYHWKEPTPEQIANRPPAPKPQTPTKTILWIPKTVINWNAKS